MTQPDRKAEFQLNVPLLVATVVVMVIVGVAGYFWHSRQSGKLASSLLSRANQYADEHEYADAVQYLIRYVQLRPQDVEGRIRLAETFDETAKDARSKFRSIGYHRYAVGLAFDKPELLDRRAKLQQRLAELLLETGQYAEAKKQAEEIKHDDPANLSAQQILALAAYAEAEQKQGDVDWKSIRKSVTDAAEVNPADIKLAQCAAEICRVKLADKEPEAADTVMDRMVQANRKSAPALLARWRYRQRFNLPDADQDLDEAIQIAPNDSDTLLAAGERAARNQKWDEAQSYLNSFVKVSPKDRRGYLGLAQVQIEKGEPKAAIETYRQGQSQFEGRDIGIGWRLADLLINQRDFKTADSELNNIESFIKKNAGQWSSSVRDSALAETQFIRANWCIAQGKLMPAVQILEKLALQPVSGMEGQKYANSPAQARFMLANIFAAMEQWEQAAAAYEEVLAATPVEVLAATSTAKQLRLAAAKASLKSGKIEAAARHFGILKSEGVTSPEIELLSAQTEFQSQLLRPASKRNWAPLEAMLAEQLKQDQRSWEWLLLQSEYAIAIGQKDRAIETLKLAEDQFSENENCLQAVASCYERLEQTAEADRLYAKWQALSPTSANPLIARARSLARREQFEEATKLLNAAAASLPEAARAAVQHQIVEIQIRQGQFDEARRSLTALCESNPKNLAWAVELAELTLKAGDKPSAEELASAEKCEQRLKAIEGESGVWWKYFRARRLLLSGSQGSTAQLTESQALASEVESARPQWPQAHLLKALIAERLKQDSDAIAEYRKVIEMAGENVEVLERLTVLLQKNQPDEAWALTATLLEKKPSAQITNLAIDLSLRKAEFNRAVGLAREAVEKSPQDARAHVRLAQTLMLAHVKAPAEFDLKQAESELKRAAELDPQGTAAWATLLSLYVRDQRLSEARELLQQIEHLESLPAEARTTLLAQGYEAIQDNAEAEKWYQHAVEVAKDKTAAEQRQTSFWVRSKNSKAAEGLRTLEQAADTSKERRQLAVEYLRMGDAKSLEKALRLLSDKQTDTAEAAANDRLKCEVLLKRDAPGDRDEVLNILTALSKSDGTALPRDRLILAGLLEQRGDMEAARRHYEALALSSTADPNYWVVFAEFLLRSDATRDADTWVRRLEEKDPKSFATIALRARILQKEGKNDLVEPIVEPAVGELLSRLKNNAEKAQVELIAGQLYMQGKQFDQAIRHFREAYQQNPSTYAPLIAALVQAKQIKQAAEVCRDAIKDKSATQSATVLAAALINNKASVAELNEAEPAFAAALEADPGNLEVLVAVSGLRFIQGKYDDVVRLSRQVLKKDPKHVLAMNNLASLLAEDPEKRAESIAVIDRAIEVAGRSATLLDTKAVALLYDDHPKEALELLKEAIKESPNDPRYLFHLAIVYKSMGDVRAARETLLRAEQAKLLNALLTPREQTALEELRAYVGTNQQTRSTATPGESL